MHATGRNAIRRSRSFLGTLLLVLASACAAGPPAPVRLIGPTPSAPPSVGFHTATVVVVLDADSIELRLDDGRDLHVQLIGIDAPDSGRPLRGHANTFVRSKLPKGRRVYLEQGPTMWDDHGRYLAYVWLKRPSKGTLGETSASMLNAMLLVAGYAEIEAKDENPKYGTLFRQLERNAKRAHKGIWA